MHTAIHSRKKTGSESKLSLKVAALENEYQHIDKKDRRALIIEVLKFAILIALFAFAIYYISWLNSAANFPEFS